MGTSVEDILGSDPEDEVLADVSPQIIDGSEFSLPAVSRLNSVEKTTKTDFSSDFDSSTNFLSNPASSIEHFMKIIMHTVEELKSKGKTEKADTLLGIAHIVLDLMRKIVRKRQNKEEVDIGFLIAEKTKALRDNNDDDLDGIIASIDVINRLLQELDKSLSEVSNERKQSTVKRKRSSQTDERSQLAKRPMMEEIREEMVNDVTNFSINVDPVETQPVHFINIDDMPKSNQNMGIENVVWETIMNRIKEEIQYEGVHAAFLMETDDMELAYQKTIESGVFNRKEANSTNKQEELSKMKEKRIDSSDEVRSRRDVVENSESFLKSLEQNVQCTIKKVKFDDSKNVYLEFVGNEVTQLSFEIFRERYPHSNLRLPEDIMKIRRRDAANLPPRVYKLFKEIPEPRLSLSNFRRSCQLDRSKSALKKTIRNWIILDSRFNLFNEYVLRTKLNSINHLTRICPPSVDFENFFKAITSVDFLVGGLCIFLAVGKDWISNVGFSIARIKSRILSFLEKLFILHVEQRKNPDITRKELFHGSTLTYLEFPTVVLITCCTKGFQVLTQKAAIFNEILRQTVDEWTKSTKFIDERGARVNLALVNWDEVCSQLNARSDYEKINALFKHLMEEWGIVLAPHNR